MCSIVFYIKTIYYAEYYMLPHGHLKECAELTFRWEYGYYLVYCATVQHRLRYDKDR